MRRHCSSKQRRRLTSMAVPALLMMARTSAKSTLMRPGTVMMSLIPWVVPEGAAAKGSQRGVQERLCQ